MIWHTNDLYHFILQARPGNNAACAGPRPCRSPGVSLPALFGINLKAYDLL